MTVVMIDEENHGTLAVAKDFESAKDFLINEHWIAEDLVVYSDNMNNWDTIENIFGADWKNKIKSMDEKEFEDTFVDTFFLNEVDVYGA
jgi:hypothetical protein